MKNLTTKKTLKWRLHMLDFHQKMCYYFISQAGTKDLNTFGNEARSQLYNELDSIIEEAENIKQLLDSSTRHPL